MTQLGFRHGVTIDLPTNTPAFSARRYYRLLNVPDALSSAQRTQAQQYSRGYVVISAKNAVLAIRRTVTVELADMVDVQYVAPGRPAYYAIDEFGADFDYQLIQVTTYNHDDSGRPIGLVLRDETPQITAQYRPNGDIPILPEYRTSIHQTVTDAPFQLIGGQWRATIPLELGPPGIYAIEYASVRNSAIVSAQTGIPLFQAIEWFSSSAFWESTASTSTGRPAVLPQSASTLYGVLGEKPYYTDTGSFNLRFSASVQPVVGDLWEFQANVRLVGLGPMLQADI